MSNLHRAPSPGPVGWSQSGRNIQQISNLHVAHDEVTTFSYAGGPTRLDAAVVAGHRPPIRVVRSQIHGGVQGNADGPGQVHDSKHRMRDPLA